MKKMGIILILFFLFCLFIFSQDYKGNARVGGVVYDEQGKPLEGVKVKLFCPRAGGGFETMTDKDGKWKGSWLRGGMWNLDFEKAGYMPKKISVEIYETQKNPMIEIKLKKVEGLIITDELKTKLTQGNALFEEGKFEEAVKVYKEIIEKFPDAYIVNKNIGNCYFKLEKYDQAEECYQKVLEKLPEDPDIMLLIGNCYANRGQNEKALEWYGKIAFEKIKDATVLYNIGTNYYNNSKFEEALNYYKRAVEIKNDFTDALYQLGLTHLTMRSYKDAITAFENYLKYDPNSDRATQVKGFIEFLKKKIEIEEENQVDLPKINLIH